jgi:hypothetical protein
MINYFYGLPGNDSTNFILISGNDSTILIFISGKDSTICHSPQSSGNEFTSLTSRSGND